MEKQEKKKLTRDTLRQSMRIFRYLTPYKWEFGLGLFFLLLTSIASLAFPKFLGDLVDSASKELVENIDRVALILIAILILQAVFGYFRIILFVRVTEKMLASLRQATYDHLIRLPMTFFSSKRVGELTSRISADISLLQETFTTTLAEFIRQMIIIIGGITLLTITSWKLTLFMLAILPAIVIIAVVFGRFIRRYAKDVQSQVAESNTIVEETLQSIQTVKAFTNEVLEIRRYKKKTDEVAKTAIKGGVYRGAFASFIITGLFGAIVAVIWRGSILVQNGDLAVGQLFSFVIYSGFIGGSIGGLADIYARLQKAIGATEELMEILDEPIEEQQNQTDSDFDMSGKIELKNIHFSYPGRKDMEVIKGVDLLVQPGEQVALVGMSGAGKTTLSALLYRFYDITSGQILFDDRDASSLNRFDIRSRMALVPQEVLLFGGSIMENIRYGNPQATDEEVFAAAKKANAHDFIQSFPDGYETEVGERGIQLSGGQRQRIAIARALLKDPVILVLDEATSSLDSESEHLVQEALDQLMKGRTTFVIAHRLSTIRKADKIAVMQDGQVVEIGSHEELLKRPDGEYRKLVQLQVGEV